MNAHFAEAKSMYQESIAIRREVGDTAEWPWSL